MPEDYGTEDAVSRSLHSLAAAARTDPAPAEAVRARGEQIGRRRKGLVAGTASVVVLAVGLGIGIPLLRDRDSGLSVVTPAPSITVTPRPPSPTASPSPLPAPPTTAAPTLASTPTEDLLLTRADLPSTLEWASSEPSQQGFGCDPGQARQPAAAPSVAVGYVATINGLALPDVSAFEERIEVAPDRPVTCTATEWTTLVNEPDLLVQRYNSAAEFTVPWGSYRIVATSDRLQAAAYYYPGETRENDAEAVPLARTVLRRLQLGGFGAAGPAASPSPRPPVSVAPLSLPQWAGTYRWEEALGDGSGQTRTYQLVLSGRSSPLTGRLSIQGFQTDQTVAVEAAAFPGIQVTVSRQATGLPPTLVPGQLLLSLDGTPEAPRTCLAALEVLRADLPTCGTYFTRG